MSVSAFHIRFVSATFALFVCGGVSAQIEQLPCATVNAGTILLNSATSKAAQERLAAEFAPQFAIIEPMASERNRVERLWLDAKQAGRPADEVDALKAQRDKAASAEREAGRPLRQALERRKQEELGTLIQRLNEIYKRIGTEQGFKLLLQNGEREPVFVLDRNARRSDCGAEIDLTSQIMGALDQGEAVKP